MKKFLTFYHYRIEGFNLNYVINGLRKRGVFIYNMKKRDKKTLLLTINAVNEKKLFAITNGLCYNVLKIGENGLFTILSFIKRRLSLFFLIIFFFASIIVFNNFLIKIEVEGSGSSKKEEIKSLLLQNGVKEYSFFLGDVSELKKQILNTGYFSFCSVDKRGNVLKIEVVRVEEEKNVEEKYSLTSPTEGKIVSLKVYKGTALKEVNDLVFEGEEIVAGFERVLEESVKTPVFAEAKIEYLGKTEFSFNNEVGESFILLLIREESSYDALIEKIDFYNFDGKYVYTVEYKGYVTITVGG